MCRQNNRKFVDTVVCVTDVNDASLPGFTQCASSMAAWEDSSTGWLHVPAGGLPSASLSMQMSEAGLRGLHRCPRVCLDLAWVTALACGSSSSHVLCAVVSCQRSVGDHGSKVVMCCQLYDMPQKVGISMPATCRHVSCMGSRCHQLGRPWPCPPATASATAARAC
jgi:hypothetical protein